MERGLEGTEPTEDESSDFEETEPTEDMNPGDGLMFLLIFISGIAATGIFIWAGVSMLQIHSQGSQEGNVSIMELYYHAMGLGFIGFGALSALLTVKSLWNKS